MHTKARDQIMLQMIFYSLGGEKGILVMTGISEFGSDSA